MPYAYFHQFGLNKSLILWVRLGSTRFDPDNALLHARKMGPYKLLQPPRQWSRPHEPTSIMANAQRKVIYVSKHGQSDPFGRV